MNLYVKRFNELTTDELYEILRLRVNVFVVEQNCFSGVQQNYPAYFDVGKRLCLLAKSIDE